MAFLVPCLVTLLSVPHYQVSEKITVAVTSTFINNFTSSVSEKEKKSPVWRVACFLTTNDYYSLIFFNLPSKEINSNDIATFSCF